MTYLFIGVLIGIILEKYIIPCLNVKLELFTYKESEKITKSQLISQELAIEFTRKYPEGQSVQEKAPLIGFQTATEEEYENDDFDDY